LSGSYKKQFPPYAFSGISFPNESSKCLIISLALSTD